MKNKEITNIRIESIHQHPENPRKDLGDLEELAESIKKNGVMQNLTVIPLAGKPGEYIAIIGHRRHAAAKLAGILEVPCRIVEEMSEKEQVSTMLEENMQRNDLTIYEQAQGFQMMLNLGETEETIAQKTGFSKTTIKHRLNIAKLNQKELKKKEQDDDFQLTLKDLYELEKIEDIKARNKILKESGSSRDLIWKVRNAVTEAERAKKTKQIVDMLKEKGIEKAPDNAQNEQYSGKWEVVKEFELDKNVPKQIRLKETNAVYYLPYFRSVRVIKRAKKEKRALTQEEIKRKQIDQNKKLIEAKIEEMNANCKEFIKNIISGKIDEVKDENQIRESIWKIFIEADTSLHPSGMRKFYTGKETYECKEKETTEAQKQIDTLSFTHSMLVALHSIIKEIGGPYDYYGHYELEEGNALMHAYEILKRYGWTFVNDDDEQLLDGTHELYEKREQ